MAERSEPQGSLDSQPALPYLQIEGEGEIPLQSSRSPEAILP